MVLRTCASTAAALVNFSATAVFVVTGLVAWSGLGAMVPAAVLGGYLGGRLAQRVPQRRVRQLVLALSWCLAAWYFWKTYR